MNKRKTVVTAVVMGAGIIAVIDRIRLFSKVNNLEERTKDIGRCHNDFCLMQERYNKNTEEQIESIQEEIGSVYEHFEAFSKDKQEDKYMKLVIAEKPSVAISIAKVIGANKKKDGYYEGNGYKVSWCVGHLIQMANPDAYNEKYAKWNIEDLPIIPKDYKYEVAKSTKKQFNILKKLMNDKEIDTVINACDAGREGESIFRLVYNEAKCKKKMQRLWISSMEDSAIKEGFDNLKDGKDYDNLFESAQARAIADWLVGMNISRLYSCLYKQNYSVGRVQTPTLSMIVKRYDEIANFKKEKYYTVELSMEGFTLSTDRIDDEISAEQLLNLAGDKI